MRLILLLLLASRLYSQSDLDSLKKYSYPIHAWSDNYCYNGTGFLYKTERALYLVTNYHILTNINTLTGTTEYEQPNYANIFYTGKNGIELCFKVEIPDKLKKADSFYWYHKFDLIAIPIDRIPVGVPIYTVNHLINKATFTKHPTRVYVYGFPGLETNGNGCRHCEKTRESKLINNYQRWYDSTKVLIRTDSQQKALNRAIIKIKRNYNCIKGSMEHGMSGSPVWGVYSNKGVTEVSLLGIVFSGNTEVGHEWSIKPKMLARYLERLDRGDTSPMQLE